jgi:hypothetical protein
LPNILLKIDDFVEAGIISFAGVALNGLKIPPELGSTMTGCFLGRKRLIFSIISSVQK